MNLLNKKSFPFFIFTGAVFLILIVVPLFETGMFLDGLIYATLGRNLSEGIGSWWFLKNTHLLEATFHEHPPLGIWIQSFLFYIFGDYFWVERLHAFLLALLTVSGIISIYKNITKTYVSAWFPVLLWSITGIIFWSFEGNVLENTVSVFTLGAVGSFFYYKNNKNKLFLILSGLLILGAFLTKGPVGLFPWGIPFLYWLVFREDSFFGMTLSVLIIAGTTLLGLGLILFFNAAAWESFQLYLEAQLFSSLKGERLVVERYFIIKRTIQELAPMIVLCILILFLKYKFNLQKLREEKYLKYSLFFVLIGLSATLPMVISPKQLSFYIVPSIPFFAIGLSLLVHSILENFILNLNKKYFHILKAFSLLLFSGSIIFVVLRFGQPGRDIDLQADIAKIHHHPETKNLIHVPNELSQEWSLFSYAYRNHHFTIAPKVENATRFYLAKKGAKNIPEGYAKVPLDLKLYDLYKK